LSRSVKTCRFFFVAFFSSQRFAADDRIGFFCGPFQCPAVPPPFSSLPLFSLDSHDGLLLYRVSLRSPPIPSMVSSFKSKIFSFGVFFPPSGPPFPLFQV